MNYNQALELAKLYHYGQFRRKSGLPYVTHPIAVANKFKDETHRIVAILHDVLEDTTLTMYELIRNYRPSDEIIDALEAITKEPDEIYINFILRIKKNKIATQVKIEDLRHNLSDLGNGNLREKYLMALYILDKDDNEL
jgi:(p)ppGpp synthase/HD superfamily hydrolase